MRYVPATILMCGVVLAIDPSAGSQSNQAIVVFQNVTILAMDADRVVARQTVVVRGSTIESVSDARRSPPPPGAFVIDGTGQFLMPGLADMHIHLPGPTAPAGRAESELFLYVANGVTTARSMAGVDAHFRLRERIDAGELVGPTLILAGPGLDGERVKSPDDGIREVRMQKERGYDLVKVLPGLSVASYDAIRDTARALGIRFAGHVPAAVGIQHAIESGQETIEHLDGYLEFLKGREPLTMNSIIPLADATRKAGIWNVPTMAVMAANVGAADVTETMTRHELEYIDREYVDQWVALRARSNIPPPVSEVIQANRLRLLKAMNDAGARILFGTDSPQLFNAPGFSVVREMQMMVEAGMTPYQVLRTATQQVGEYLQRPCGTITPGACADLILLEGNPLRDFGHLVRKRGVMAHGRWLTRNEIEDRLRRIHDRSGNYRRP